MNSSNEDDAKPGDVQSSASRPDSALDFRPDFVIGRRLRMIKTGSMFLVYVGLGFSLGVAYATLVDMVALYHTSYDAVTSAQMVKAVGLMTGFLCGSPLADRCGRHLDLFLCLFSVLFGLASCAMPWSPNLIVMGALFAISGWCHSTLDICCVTTCMRMWGKRASAPVMGMYTSLMVGSTISPLITSPFLSRPLPAQPTNGTAASGLEHSTSFLQMFFFETDESQEHANVTMSATRMYVPFAMFGVWSIVVGVLFLVFYLEGTRYPTVRVDPGLGVRTLVHPGTCAQGSAAFGLFCITSVFICFFSLNGRDRGFGMFVFTIANKGLNADKSTASLVLFCFNLTGTLARGACALLALCVPVQVILTTIIAGAVTTQTLLLMYGLQSVEHFWILSCLTSLFITPSYPTLMAWANVYIDVTGVVTGVFNVGIGLGGLSCMFLSGYLFDHSGSHAVLQLALIYGAALAGMFLLLQTVAHWRGNKYQVQARRANGTDRAQGDAQQVREAVVVQQQLAADDGDVINVHASTEYLLPQ